VLDLGCGTGNAALLAARAGARVIGVDPATRLLDVARSRAAAAGLDVDFRPGEAAALPLPDRSLDAVVSVFGIVFAADAHAAAAEVARVLRPGGRLLLAAWTPVDAPAGPGPLRRQALAEAGHHQPSDGGFPWHDPDALTALLGPLGFVVEVARHDLVITATSPRAYAEADFAGHPLWVQARAVLEPTGRWERLRDEVIRLQTALNEDPAGFRVTCPYVVVTARLAA
jgi:SAM-dependent methyltransferase